MKVLFILPGYEPAWSFGGVIRCISTLCRGMVKIGIEVSVYTTNSDGSGGLLAVEDAEPVNVGGATVRYFPSTFGQKSVWDSRMLIRALGQSIRDFDIVYISAIWQWLGISAGRLSRKHRVPYVIGTHGAFDKVLLRESRTKKKIFYHLFLKKCVMGASAVHFTTEYERRQSCLLESGPSNFVIPNCMDTEAFKPDPSLRRRLRQEFNIGQDAPVLLAVGRADPKKRLDLVLKALRNLCRSHPDSRLLVVGRYDNGYGLEMKALADSLGLREEVIWTGYRTGNDLDACFLGADLFVLPSIDENFGMAVIEAMAHGVAVVVSDHVGVADDVLRCGAGVVVPVDSSRINKAVRDIVDDLSLRMEMGRNARQATQQLYNYKAVSQLMATAFRDILSNSTSQECRWE